MKTARLFAVVAAAALVTLMASGALASDRTRQKMELVGFSDDGKEFVLKVTDEERGTFFQVRTTKKNEIVKVYPFAEGEDKKVFAKVKRVHEVGGELSDSPENPKKGVTLMSAQKEDKLFLYVMKGDRIAKYDEIALEKTRKGDPAKSNVMQMAWDPKGKYGVVVYHQKLTDLGEWEGDFVYSFVYRSYKVNFGDDSGDGDE